MPYVGRDLQRGNYLKLDDISSSFNGSTTTFNLQSGGSAFYPGSAFSIFVSVGGVIQEPESAYTINKNTITFANAPHNVDDCFIIALGLALGVGVPGHGTVNGSQLAKPFNYDGGLFYLDSTNDRVGVGITTPEYTLDVNGVANFRSNVSIAGTITYQDVAHIDSVGIVTAQTGIHLEDYIFHKGDLNTKLGFPAADTFTVETAGSERVRVGAGGSVGIGITNPDEFLHVNGVGAGIKVDSNGDSAFRWATSGTNKYSLYHNNGANALIFYDNTNDKERIRLTSGGNVGIATANATHTLHTYGTGNSGGVRFENSHTTTTVSGNTASGAFPHNILLSNYSGNGAADNRMASIGFDIPCTSAHANATIAYQATNGSGNGDLQFWLEENNTSKERLRITGIGSVGIGTDKPTTHLQLHGTDANLQFRVTKEGVGSFNHGVDSTGAFLETLSSDDIPIRLYAGGGPRLRINTNGHILTQSLTGLSFSNDGSNIKAFEITGDGTVGEYGVLNLSGTQDTNNLAAGEIKFINTQNSNSSSASNAGSKQVASIKAYIRTSDTNAGDDSGGYLSFITKNESSGNVERFRITQGGQVNIGTNNLDQTTFKSQIETGTNRFISFGTAAHDDLSDEGSGVIFSRPSDGSKALSAIFGHGNSNLGLSARGTLTFHAGGTSTYSAAPEAFRVDANRYLLAGHTTRDDNIAHGTAGKMQLWGTSWANAGLALVNTQTSTDPAFISFAKSRSPNASGIGTAGAVVVSGDRLGEIRFAGDDGSDMHSFGASIAAYASGTIAGNRMPGKLVFATTNDAASAVSPSTRMVLYPSGLIELGTGAVNIAKFCQSGNYHQIVGQAATGVAALDVYSQHGSDNAKISFAVSDNRTGSKSNAFVVSGTGKVGIGLTDNLPNAELHIHKVNGTIATFGDSRGSTFERIAIKNNVAGYPAITNDSSPDTLDLRSMGSTQVTIDSNNNSTGKYFRVMTNGEGNAGTEIFKVTDVGEISGIQDYPLIDPTLDLNFAATKKLDSRVKYFRKGPASYVNDKGLVKMVGENTPRFNHDPKTRECKGLLIEEQRKNYLSHSNFVTSYGSGNAWVYGVGTDAYTASSGSQLSTNPDGSSPAYHYVPATGTGYHRFNRTFTVDEYNKSYVVSVFAKRVTEGSASDFNRYLEIELSGSFANNTAPSGHSGAHGMSSVTFDLQDITSQYAGNAAVNANGNVGSPKIEDYGDGWYRCSYIFNPGTDDGSGSLTGSIWFGHPATMAADTGNENPNGHPSFYLWGAMIEKGDFLTSYIPNHGAWQSTRRHETCVVDGEEFTDFYNQHQGTLVSEFLIHDPTTLTSGAIANINAISTDSYADSIMFMEIGTNSGYYGRVYKSSSGTGLTGSGNITTNGIMGGKTINRVSYAWSDPTIDQGSAAYRNGVVQNTSTIETNTPTNLTELRIGRGWGSQRINADIRRLIYYPVRLPDSQLSTLSA